MYDYNIMVIGDYGLDITREGPAERMSPEAPVPVVLNPEPRRTPGLAGNVAANVASLGARVLCFGVVGESRYGELTFDTYIRHRLVGAPTTLTRDRGRLATVKERIVSDGHQIVRVDSESTHDIEAHIEDMIINQIEASSKWSDGIIISDYGKGVCTSRLVYKAMDVAHANDIPIFVDPKHNLLIYHGATILKPNAAEWKAYKDAFVDTEVHAKFIVVTCGELGMNIVAHRNEDGKILYNTNFPGYKVPVHDRTGAGDTAMAVMALEYIHTKDISRAVKLANFAGALAVQCSGTYRATEKDLRHMPPEGATIASVDEAAEAYVSATIDRLEKLGL